jgi:predicted DNA-binding protein (UPF0251 family)
VTTVKELAETLGISRSTVRRRIREALPDLATGEGSAITLTPEQVHQVVHHLTRRDAVSSDAVGAALASGNSVSGASGDAVLAHQMARFGAPDDAVVTRLEQVQKALHDAELEASRLRAEVDGLKAQNDLLRERLEVADAALKREQEQARGFWSRLGQRLLGSGRETR